jgi:CRISPR/Cas system-associated protein Cas5 (RAMP superfamily)
MLPYGLAGLLFSCVVYFQSEHKSIFAFYIHVPVCVSLDKTILGPLLGTHEYYNRMRLRTTRILHTAYVKKYNYIYIFT